MFHFSLTSAFVVLGIGFLFLGFGAEFLVKGAAALAKRLGVSTLLIGLTIIAMGTSLPEMVTAIIAALHGSPNIAVGSSVGSNIVNITLLLGITAVLMPLTVHPKMFKQDMPILVLVMVVVGMFLWDGYMSRADGVLLLMAAVAYVLMLVWQSRDKKTKKDKKLLTQEYEQEIDKKMSLKLAIFFLVLGLIILPISSEGVIQSSIFIAKYYHISDLVIGLTIVAFGTSLAEFATCLIAARRKEYDIVIGNIIGSNILNLLVVLALAAVITPFHVMAHAFSRDWSWMLFVTLAFYFITYGRKGSKNITRFKGAVLIMIYLVYLGYLYISESGIQLFHFH